MDKLHPPVYLKYILLNPFKWLPLRRHSPTKMKLLSYEDALVVTMIVVNYAIHRILVDYGSSANILYCPTFERLKISGKNKTSYFSPSWFHWRKGPADWRNYFASHRRNCSGVGNSNGQFPSGGPPFSVQCYSW